MDESGEEEEEEKEEKKEEFRSNREKVRSAKVENELMESEKG